MILTDREIKIALRRGWIVIDPPPQDEFFASTSVDLTLDPIITEFKQNVPGSGRYIAPNEEGFNIEKVLADITQQTSVDGMGYFELKPKIMILGWTKEYINLNGDSRIAARVEGKSTMARLGVGVHITAPTIHAGFDGRIRLEIVNHGPFPVRLFPGMRICQLIFETTLGTPDKGYQGQFAGQDITRTV